MGFSRQEYWSGFLFPSPGDLPNPGIKPGSPALQADSLPLSHQGSPQKVYAEQNVVSAPSVKGKGDTPPSNHNIINNIEGRGNLGYDHCSFCLEGTGWGPSSWMPRDEPQYLRVNVLPRASLSRTQCSRTRKQFLVAAAKGGKGWGSAKRPQTRLWGTEARDQFPWCLAGCLVLSKTAECLPTRCSAGHLVLSKTSIRFVVHAKGSLRFGHIQNIHEHMCSVPNGFAQDPEIKGLLEWTKWSSKYREPFGLGQMSYGPNVTWMFWTEPNVCQPQDSSQPREQQWASPKTNWPWGLKKGSAEVVEMEILWCWDDPQGGEAWIPSSLSAFPAPTEDLLPSLPLRLLQSVSSRVSQAVGLGREDALLNAERQSPSREVSRDSPPHLCMLPLLFVPCLSHQTRVGSVWSRCTSPAMFKGCWGWK